MESDPQQQQYLKHFHQLLFNDKLENGNPAEKADILRSIVLLLKWAHPLKILPDDCPNALLTKYQEMYAQVMDGPDAPAGQPVQGGGQSCKNGGKSESSRWQSSLTLEGIKSKDFMKQFYKKTEAKQAEGSPMKDQPLFKNMQFANKTVSRKGEQVQAIDHSTPDANSGGMGHPAFHPQPTPGQSLPAFGGAPGAFSWTQTGVQGGPGNSAPGSGSSSKWDQYTGSAPGERQALLGKRGRDNGDDGNAFGQPSLFSGPGNAVSRGAFGGFSREASHRSDPSQVPMEVEDEGSANDGDRRFQGGPFRTAKEQLMLNAAKKFGHVPDQSGQVSNASYGNFKKSLGTRRGGPSNRFIPPVMQRDDESSSMAPYSTDRQPSKGPEEPQDERLRGIDQKLVELIMSDIMDSRSQIAWNDIAGLEFAKKTMKEVIVWPMLRPDIFTGLRGPPKGLLLFGPPGTGKTLIGKCIASQSKSTFFSISASSLTSKWVGEGEKMVKALFAVARCKQPSVIFIDEIDSLLSQRSDGEHEASRRIKTEFLVQLDGAATDSEDRILVIGATNRPQEIDEAARRRFVKRLYIPLPETEARRQIIVNLMSTQTHCLSEADILEIAERTDGYSGADMANLCREASLGPIRSLPFDDIENIQADQVRPIVFSDFHDALTQVRASVSEKDLDGYLEWNNTYGSFGK